MMKATKGIGLSTALIFSLLVWSTNNACAQQLYTMTTQGGSFSGTCNNDVPQCGLGMILSYNLDSGTITPLFDFTDSTGYIPDGYLMQASDGNLYGLTTNGGLNALAPGNVIPSGGINAGGTLFQYNFHTRTFTVEQPLDADAVPGGALMEAGDGNLYGLTLGDGDYGGGTLFQYNYNTNTYNPMLSLPDSSWPGGCTLMEAGDGNLYGLTTSNGANLSGTLFQYNYNNNTYIVKKNLSYGAWPYGSTLIEASDSNLYGMTYADGAYNSGTLFQYNYRLDTFIVKWNLPEYARPYGCQLTQASDGNLYGLTYGDGAHRSGTIFQYNPVNSHYKPVYSLPDSAWPWGSLMEASDSNLYGFTQWNGADHEGTLFRYDYRNDTFTVMVNFNGTNGAFPIYSRLLEVNDSLNTGIRGALSESFAATVYPNPSSGRFILNLVSPADESAVIKITNLTGQTMLEQKIAITPGNNTVPFNLANHAGGVYFLNVHTANGVVTRKLVLTN